jgi:fatty acid desaturase
MTTVQPLARATPTSLYGTLLAEVRTAGLLDRSIAIYVPRLVTVAAMTAVGFGLLFWFGDSTWQLAVAAYAGIVLAQLAFLGHDAGHQQVSRSRRRNDIFGEVLATLVVGISYQWWVDKHNRHHRNPNEVGSDPDVGRGTLAWTVEQAAGQRGLLRVIARHQAAFFFPLLLLEGWSLHVSSIQAVSGRPQKRRLERLLLLAHVALGLTLLLLVMSPLRALEFVAIQESVLGLYLGCSFAPNHKGMPMPDHPLDFVDRQVLTSRNVAGGRAVAMLFGGLNYQIEHHLFPSMPSRNLARCRPIVRNFCATHAMPYAETSLLRSYAQSLRYLGSLRPT